MKKVIAALFVIFALSTALLPACGFDAEDVGGMILIDMGNGVTHWSDVTASGTCIDIAQNAAGSLGLEFVSSGSGILKIGDFEEHRVGSQLCSWRLYEWDGVEWMPADAGSAYSGGHIAWGFYPEGSVAPVVTPDSMSCWIQSRGDSSMSGTSGSYGTESAAVPVEWYKTYSTGMVCSSIVVAGDLLYHTTNGSFGGTTSDSHAWLYCIDRFTGKEVWRFDLSTGGQDISVRAPGGYDITSPVIAGDTIIVNSTSEHTDDFGSTIMYMYCLDRIDGTLLHSEAIAHSPPLDSDGDVRWTGRTFVTGGTTPVYDSGALYLGTSDGRILCYSVSRESGFQKLWEYVPPSTMSGDTYAGTRGSFYFHSPVIVDVGGVRMLFMGNYEGYIFSLNASTGTLNWARKLIDLGSDNKPHPGTPGSVSTITFCPDGRLVVGCTDGGLSSLTGYTLCIDASTGEGPAGSDYYWKIEALLNQPVSDGTGFYSYVSPSNNGSSVLTNADGTESAVRSAIYKFDYEGRVVWTSVDYQTVKASLTLADGTLYATDYSAGVFYPSGGGLTALDSEDGSEIWRVKLSPFSADSYSMVSPTVIDGRIYVGNDYGAIYCVSEVAGPSWDGGKEIVLSGGMSHWSWLLLLAVTVSALFMLYRLY